MGDALVDAFARIERDDDVRVVILTGAGKGFCSGDDVEAGSPRNPRWRYVTSRRGCGERPAAPTRS